MDGWRSDLGRIREIYLGKCLRLHRGHQVLADAVPNAVALSNARQAFGFTVTKSGSGMKNVFGSGQFPHYSGSIPEHLKRIVLELVE